MKEREFGTPQQIPHFTYSKNSVLEQFSFKRTARFEQRRSEQTEEKERGRALSDIQSKICWANKKVVKKSLYKYTLKKPSKNVCKISDVSEKIQSKKEQISVLQKKEMIMNERYNQILKTYHLSYQRNDSQKVNFCQSELKKTEEEIKQVQSSLAQALKQLRFLQQFNQKQQIKPTKQKKAPTHKTLA